MKAIELVKTAYNVSKDFLGKNSPTILTGVAVVSAAGTLYLATKATLKAVEILKEEEEKRTEEAEEKNYEPKPMSKPEKVAAVWKCYIPPVLATGLTITCAIGSNTINARRNAALVSALVLSQDTLKSYKDEIAKKLPTKQAQEVRDGVATDMVQKKAPQQFVETGHGDLACLELFMGHAFRASKNEIDRAVNTVNYLMNMEGAVYLSDFYDELNIPRSASADNFAWVSEDGPITVQYGADLTRSGEPVLTIEFGANPVYKYGHF